MVRTSGVILRNHEGTLIIMTALGYYAKVLAGPQKHHGPSHSLFHRDHGSKSCLTTEHVLVRFIGLLQWELLDHAVDVVQARITNGFLAIHSMT